MLFYHARRCSSLMLVKYTFWSLVFLCKLRVFVWGFKTRIFPCELIICDVVRIYVCTNSVLHRTALYCILLYYMNTTTSCAIRFSQVELKVNSVAATACDGADSGSFMYGLILCACALFADAAASLLFRVIVLPSIAPAATLWSLARLTIVDTHDRLPCYSNCKPRAAVTTSSYAHLLSLVTVWFCLPAYGVAGHHIISDN